MDVPDLHRPTPRRPFDIGPASAETSRPPSPPVDGPVENTDTTTTNGSLDVGSPPTRDTSILNLTSSTLLGIYSKQLGEGGRDDPLASGEQTPAYPEKVHWSQRPELPRVNFDPRISKPRASSMKKPRVGMRRTYLSVLQETASLFVFGFGVGMVVTQLQRTQQIAPVPVPPFAKPSWVSQLLWGVLGVVVGTAYPRFDALLDKDDEAAVDGQMDIQRRPKTTRSRSGTITRVELHSGPTWLDAVRSIGAFVGIAFAARQVPWRSTLQVSLTLAFANPVLWYLIDRSRSGFALSTGIALAGSTVLLLVSPDFVPVPALHQDQASEKFGVHVWVASILFCTSLSFGAVGRKL